MQRDGPRQRNSVPASILALGVTLGLLASLPASHARVRGVAVLKSHDIEPYNQAVAGFGAACPDHPTEFSLRGTDRAKADVVKSILAAKPRLVLAVGALAARVAKEELRGIPVIFFMVPRPQRYGLDGQNIAGISLDIPAERQFTTYKTLAPGIRTIGVVYDPDKTGAMIADAEEVARRLGLRLIASAARSEKQVPAALRSMLGKIDALWMVPDDTVVTPDSFRFLLLAALENNLPFMVVSDIFVEAGALAALSPDYEGVGRQACRLATEIDRGRLSLADANIVPPEKVNLSVNLRTAQKIGLTLPPEVIQSASKVYR